MERASLDLPACLPNAAGPMQNPDNILQHVAIVGVSSRWVGFYVRTIESKNPESKGHFTVFFGVPEGPEQTVGMEVDAGAKWTKVQIPATVAADYEAGKSMLNFDLGYEPQVLEFADIKLLHYGRAVKESELPRSGT